MAIVLLVKTEDGQVIELPVLGGVSLGRSSNNDYKIVDSKMSGNHCIFEVTNNGELLFKDLDSTNGSFLNNSKIHNSALVRINDVIQVGNTLIKINDKVLTSSERISIGTSHIVDKEEKSIPNMTRIGKHARAKAEKDDNTPIEKRRAIILGKSVKEKKAPETWVGVDNVLDQEVSTGNTRLLKLDKDKAKDKKKK